MTQSSQNNGSGRTAFFLRAGRVGERPRKSFENVDIQKIYTEDDFSFFNNFLFSQTFSSFGRNFLGPEFSGGGRVALPPLAH